MDNDKLQIDIDTKTLNNPTQTKDLANLQKSNPNVEFNLDGKEANSTTSSTSMAMGENESVIEIKDQSPIQFLSNVKDSKSGEVSQPFNIGDKKYQMVRGIDSNGEIKMAVYCHNDLNEAGENIIHPTEYFEENIASPMRETMGMVGQNIQVNDGYEHAAVEREHNDNEAFMDHLNLVDISPEFKIFFVNTKTGEITGKFRNSEEMAKSGVSLGQDENFMSPRTLKKFRFGNYFKKNMTEELGPEDAGTDVPKLQNDVKRLTALIKNKFSMYLTKLDKPIEQAQFLTAMAQEIGVPLNKLNTIINTYRDIAKNDTQPAVVERKIISKKALEESLFEKKVIKVINIKDIK